MAEAIEIIMQEAPAAVYIFVFLFGITVGSFLNVCIYRLPLHQSIVTVPSHCMTCGKKLHWYELVPLFSFLFLRGRCGGCKTKLSAQYPVIEGLNGLVWLAVAFIKGLTLDMLFIQLFMSALLVLAIIDARTKEIPVGINIFIGVIALARAAIYHDDIFDLVLGLLVPGTVFLLILLISKGRAMGGGDVKLLYACGLFLGFKSCIFAVCAACILGSVIHLILMKVKHLGRELAFGPYLAAGFAISALWGSKIIEWYLSYFK